MRENSPMRRNLKATRTACRVGARFDCFRARDGVQLLAEYCAVIMPFFIAGVLVSTVVNLFVHLDSRQRRLLLLLPPLLLRRPPPT
jgi:hypothetical protein